MIIIKPYISGDYSFTCVCENPMKPTKNSTVKMIHIICTVCNTTGFFYKGKMHFVDRTAIKLVN